MCELELDDGKTNRELHGINNPEMVQLARRVEQTVLYGQFEEAS